MGEIKSAWEIAMEKADRLGKLSPDELKKQKEEKLALIGQVIADKYIGGLDLWQLGVELDKYDSEERTLLQDAAASKLAQSIELGNNEGLTRIIEGISYLKQGEKVREIHEEIEKLFEEYKKAEQTKKEEMGKSAGDILQQLGISGSAIGSVNHTALGESQQELDSFAQPYGERLEQLKQKLLDIIKG